MTTKLDLSQFAGHTPTARIRLQDEDGAIVIWRVWRDGRAPSAWILRDHTGYDRTLSSVWATSVPLIKLIAENHSLKFLQEIS